MARRWSGWTVVNRAHQQKHSNPIHRKPHAHSSCSAMTAALVQAVLSRLPAWTALNTCCDTRRRRRRRRQPPNLPTPPTELVHARQHSPYEIRTPYIHYNRQWRTCTCANNNKMCSCVRLVAAKTITESRCLRPGCVGMLAPASLAPWRRLQMRETGDWLNRCDCWAGNSPTDFSCAYIMRVRVVRASIPFLNSWVSSVWNCRFGCAGQRSAIN